MYMHALTYCGVYSRATDDSA